MPFNSDINVGQHMEREIVRGFDEWSLQKKPRVER
jgi:hypothetical protein